MAASAMLDYKLLNNFVIYGPILLKFGEIVHLTLMNRPILLQFMNFSKPKDEDFRPCWIYKLCNNFVVCGLILMKF